MRFLPTCVIAVLVVALAGCAGNPAPVVNAPAPVLPASLPGCKPVSVRAPAVGEDARVYAAREKVGRLIANRRITNCAATYADIVHRFSAPETPIPAE